MSSKYRHECPEGCKVFVGNLDRHLNRDRISDIFGEFGRIRDIWLATNPPGFGFVMYEHKSDARHAVKEMNNKRLSGRLLTVELATGVKRMDGHELDDQSDRRLARDGDHRRGETHRSESCDRRARHESGRYDRTGDRYFYSSDYQRTNLSDRRPRRQRLDAEDSVRRTRTPEKRDDKHRRDDDKSRSRRRMSDQ